MNYPDDVLVAAAKGPKIELPVAEIRRKGLIPALRERVDSLKLDRLRRDIRDDLNSEQRSRSALERGGNETRRP
jgi:hypothetical protein